MRVTQISSNPVSSILLLRSLAKGASVNQNSHSMHPPSKQSGVALAISLVLLLAMTVLGIATLSATGLNEKITSNSQQKAVAFEVAESAIASVWDKAYLINLLTSDPSNLGNDPEPVASPDADTGIISDFDMVTSGRGIDLDGELTVQYCGEVAPVGSDLNADESAPTFVYKLIDVNSVVRIGNSSTVADHLQRGAATSARTNRTGSCVTR